MCSVKVLSELENGVDSGALLNYADTKDSGWFLEKYGTTSKCSNKWFVSAAAAYKVHNNPVLWQGFEDGGAIVVNQTPDWSKVRSMLRSAWKKNDERKVRVFGGLFRSKTLRQYSLDSGTTWRKAPRNRSQRDSIALRLVWESTDVDALGLYVKSPGRTAFATMCDALQAQWSQSVKGISGPYFLKQVLDLMVGCKLVAEEHISTWPIRGCPGYEYGLKKLAPRLPASQYLKALYYVHQRLSPKHRLSFPESCMQLCFQKKRKAGTLRD
jgi:hypothetical protein